MRKSEPNRKVNVWVARCVPLLIFGIIGYVSWVVTKLICVDYLLRAHPPLVTHSRSGPAIAILIVYYSLLFVMLLCYGRLLDTVARRPGLVPRGPHYYVEKQRKKKEAADEKSIASQTSSTLQPTSQNLPASWENGSLTSDFWKKDVFACNYDGRPNFCSTCYNWKPDRAHHCSELDRCVLKMDHFCPWVGGVVGETSFKFFIQFTFWAMLFCIHILISTAYFFAQRLQLFGAVNANWAVTIGLSGLFALFAGGMCGSSLQFAFTNSTTIENLSGKRKVWCLAIYIPEHKMQDARAANGDNLRLITYPRPENEQLQFVAQQDPSLPGLNMQTPNVTQDEMATSIAAVPPGPLRTFGIFETRAGENPWDLGPTGNFQDLMGYTLWDWIFPFQPSPLIRHENSESFYKLGSVVERIKRKAGISEAKELPELASKSHHKRRRRSHKSSPTASGMNDRQG